MSQSCCKRYCEKLLMTALRRMSLLLTLSMPALGMTQDRPVGAVAETQPYHVQLDTITKGFEGKPYDGKKCYTQARAGIVPRPGDVPRIVVTMSPLLLTGSDVYYELRSDDLSKT